MRCIGAWHTCPGAFRFRICEARRILFSRSTHIGVFCKRGLRNGTDLPSETYSTLFILPSAGDKRVASCVVLSVKFCACKPRAGDSLLSSAHVALAQKIL